MVRGRAIAFLLAAASATALAGEDAEHDARPAGHAGPSRGTAAEEEVRRYLDAYGYDAHDFEPRPDRWRAAMPAWSRYGPAWDAAHGTDGPYMRGRAANPYRQNVLKGDYPILGQHTFLVVELRSDTLVEWRELPTPSGVSTADPRSDPFFGSGGQLFASGNLALSVEVFAGNAGFKPPDYRLRVTPVVNVNHLDVQQNAVVNVDVLRGTTRSDGHFALQEAFFEKHLVDLTANYDFAAVTVGIQPFVSDFRGLLFSDNNLGARLSASYDDNRLQGNLAAFWMLEKDTNSELNRFDARDQLVVIANLFRQDFVWLGYTAMLSFHYNHDDDSTHLDANGFPVRPPVAGDADPHTVDALYFGWGGDGHIGRLNVTHEAFLAAGRDSRNPIAGREVDVLAQMVFVELSVDRDWLRPRVSFLWASGDDDPADGTARGFDAIFDNPNVAGGVNSFWIRQGVRLLGLGLVQRLSAFPTLRSSKIEGQANFVNPGLFLFNAGLDAELTTELRASLNLSYLRFAETGVLEAFVNQNAIDAEIGFEATLSAQYRPLLTNNVQIAAGASVFFPGAGFRDLYESNDPLGSFFLQLTLIY